MLSPSHANIISVLILVVVVQLTLSWVHYPTTVRKSNGLFMKDYPKPSKIDQTENYRDAERLSAKFGTLKRDGISKNVAIIGGGLSGLACARYLVDAGTTNETTFSFYLQ